MARTIALNLLLKTLGLKNVKDAADAFDQLEKRTAKIGTRAGLAGGLAAAGGAAVQLTAALAPMVGAAGALPGVFASVKTATLTAKVAFMGMGEAMSAMAEGDAKAAAEALEKLSPAAREVAREGGHLIKSFEGVRKTVQERMFSGVVGDMRLMSANLLPTVESGMGGVAGSMNKAGKEALKFGASPLAKGTLAQVFKTTETVIGRATGAVRPFLSGIASVVKLSLPFAQRIGLAAVSGAKLSGSFLSSQRFAGMFNSVVSKGIERVTTFARILKNLGIGLFSMFKQVRVDGGSLLTTIEGVSEKFAAWAKTAQGQQRVAEIFKFLADTMKQVAQIAPLLLSPLITVAKLITGLPAPLRDTASNVLALGVVFGPLVSKVFAAAKAIAAWNIAQKATVVWSKLAAGATWLFNTALRANPIGIVVTALTALVAGLVIAYNKSETFRKVVDSAWRGIVTVAQWAWNTILKPIFNAIKSVISNVIAPVFTWLWRNVVSPAFQGIAFVIKVHWAIIQIIFKAIQYVIKNIVAPVVRWLWKSIVVPAFKGIAFAVKVAWGILQIIFKAIQYAVKNWLAPVFTWLWKKIVQPIWSALVKGIKAGWEGGVRPAFNAIKTAIKLVADSFKTAVSNIGKFWGKLRDAAKKPVKWVIDTVYTGGIKRVWDAIASKVGASPLPEAPRLARGGPIQGPGGTKADKVPIMGSRGEYVINAKSTRRYRPLLERINREGGSSGLMAKSAGLMGDPGGLGIPGFAGGGLIDGIGKFFAAAKDWFAGGAVKAAKWVTNPLLAMGDQTLGNTALGKILMGLVRQSVDGVLGWIEGKEEKLGGNGHRAVLAARSRIGTPYSWGGGGPQGPGYGFAQGAGIRGFDCSSLMQYAWYQASGKVIPRTTYTQMPWVKRVSTPREGALGFPHSGHVFMYSGGNKVIEAPYTGANVRETAARRAMFWGMPPFATADTGTAVLRPGMNHIFNGTGGMEPLVDPRKYTGGSTYHIEVKIAPGGDLVQAGAAVVKAIKAYENRNGKTWRR